MDDKTGRAIAALKELAAHKAKESGLSEDLENKGKIKLRQLGLDPNDTAKSAALAKILHDASQGSIKQGFGNFEVEGKMTPEEKMLRLGWKKDF